MNRRILIHQKDKAVALVGCSKHLVLQRGGSPHPFPVTPKSLIFPKCRRTNNPAKELKKGTPGASNSLSQKMFSCNLLETLSPFL